MGVAATWCAFREEHADQILELLGVTPTGAAEEFPESLISMARLNTGWRVLWYGKYVCPFLRTKDLERLSQNYDVVLCRVEEHVMASSSEMWSAGRRRWWLSHEGEDGPKGLSAGGDLPEVCQRIKNEMEQRQVAEGGDTAEVDYIFEVPLKVAQSIVGFKHDEDCTGHINGGFAIMACSTSKAGFFSRLFGGKD